MPMRQSHTCADCEEEREPASSSAVCTCPPRHPCAPPQPGGQSICAKHHSYMRLTNHLGHNLPGTEECPWQHLWPLLLEQSFQNQMQVWLAQPASSKISTSRGLIQHTALRMKVIGLSCNCVRISMSEDRTRGCCLQRCAPSSLIRVHVHCTVLHAGASCTSLFRSRPEAAQCTEHLGCGIPLLQ